MSARMASASSCVNGSTDGFWCLARDMQKATASHTVPLLAYLIVGSFAAMVGGTLADYSHVDGALTGTQVG